MAIGEESEWSNDDTSTDNDRPPVGGKRRMIQEGGSISRVSIKARPRDPGGGTVSTDPRRRIVLYDVIVSVEQPREEYTLVSHTDSTAQTGPKVEEPLALLALIHADTAGQRAAVHRTVSLRECLPAQSEPPDGAGLVEVNSDKEPTIRQVPDSALDSQLMEGIIYT